MTVLYYATDHDASNLEYLSIYQTMCSMVYIEPETQTQYTPEELSIEGV